MIQNDTLHVGSEAREKLISGIKKVAAAVGGTMGTGGANAVIEAVENPGHMVTNDGWTIANSIRLADPIEEMGRKILLEAISRANKQSGDGSSTTTVLTEAILEEGAKHLGEVSPMELKRSLEDCIALIEKSIKEQTREIGVDEISKVASISSEDEEIGKLIQEIYQQIGKDGIIYWDISKTTEDTYKIGKGITVNGAGYASPYLCDIDEKTGNFTNMARWKDAHVLITKQKITTAAEFDTLFGALFNKEIKEVVVFCDEFEAPVIADLVQTRAIRGFKTLLVKMPIIWKDEWYIDLAKATGATVVDPTAGISFKNMTIEHLGRVDNIIVTKDDTFIDGVQDLTEHLKALEEDGSNEAQNRMARLNTKTARLYLGAHSDSALSYKRLKVEDAISASWQALQGGIVAGGGVALANVVQTLPDTVGGKILKKALLAPVAQITHNAGLDGVTLAGPEEGLDTRTKKVVNMFEAGIVDPANIVLNAAKNSISVAAAILTANVLVTLPREEGPSAGPGMLVR